MRILYKSGMGEFAIMSLRMGRCESAGSMFCSNSGEKITSKNKDLGESSHGSAK
jgi:hypothetical protein